MDSDDIVSRMHRGLASLKNQAPNAFGIIDRLQELGLVALFGGALRGWALCGPERRPRDLDLVVESEDHGRLESTLAPYSPIKNSFGGFRMFIEPCPLDVWLLSDTHALRGKGGLTLAMLPQTTFFNLDAAAMDAGSGDAWLLPTYALDAANRVLDINREENPNPMRMLVRAIRLASDYDLSISPRLIKYMAGVVGKHEEKDVLRVAEADCHGPVPAWLGKAIALQFSA